MSRGSTHRAIAPALALLALAAGVAVAQDPPLPRPNDRYVEANRRLGPPRAGERRVVFFGSSSVQGWDLAREFPGRSFVNRGISGDNTRHMRARFEQDVVALRPCVVVIHIGAANDIGAIRREETVGNITTMIQRARAAGAKPILLSPTPRRPAVAGSGELREALRALAVAEKCPFVDVFPLVADASGALRADFARDALHLNRRGYEALRDPTLRAIDAALQPTKGILGALPPK